MENEAKFEFERVLRKEYLGRLNNLKHKKIIKIVTGIRRCGKSTLLEIFFFFFLRDGVDEKQITFINFEDYENKELRNPDSLHKYIKKRLVSKMNYIILDEIQRVEDFPDIVDSLYIKKNVDLYLTGSNSSLLSSEIATLISGRYVEIKMLPLSFKEFELLQYFVENAGIALSREKILNAVWNYDYYGDARTIDTHVKKLRSKMGSKGEYIRTIWGMGYKFDPNGDGKKA